MTPQEDDATDTKLVFPGGLLPFSCCGLLEMMKGTVQLLLSSPELKEEQEEGARVGAQWACPEPKEEAFL